MLCEKKIKNVDNKKKIYIYLDVGVIILYIYYILYIWFKDFFF